MPERKGNLKTKTAAQIVAQYERIRNGLIIDRSAGMPIERFDSIVRRIGNARNRYVNNIAKSIAKGQGEDPGRYMLTRAETRIPMERRVYMGLNGK